MIDGPAWAKQGLDQREGRYPLAVEAPVLSMVATLVPGVSTLTQFARYFTLYWSIAARAERDQLDAGACRRLVRRAELLYAAVSTQSDSDTPLVAHGSDALARGLDAGRPFWQLADEGKGSYSPRAWGFWSQYGGPSDMLGTVSTDAGALREGRHRCPPQIRDLFRPLLDIAGQKDEPITDLLESLKPLALSLRDSPDLDALCEIFTATRGGGHNPRLWTSPDLVRRSSLRVLARSVVLEPDAANRLDALRRAVAYGSAIAADPVLADEGEYTAAWRGLLLRHHSVGAWRRLWAGLVAYVKETGLVTRDGLHDWIADRLPDQRVGAVVDELPPTADREGHPVAAEDLLDGLARVHADVAVLMLGARRRGDLHGASLVSFLGGKRAGRGTFLDPTWVARRISDHTDRSLRDLGRVLVDDMLAQSRRVALRKVQVRDGRLQVFSRLHERNGTYTARTAEGSGNVGLRIEQLSGIAAQLGLFDDRGLTALGCDLLEIPA